MVKKRVIYKELLTPEEALSRITEHVKLEPLGVEEVEIEEALNRVLAENVKSPINLPPFNRSRVDGYAVKSHETFKASLTNPVKLKVIGKVEAGEASKYKVGEGEAVEIATGAVLPEGCDAVVMVEYTREYNGVVEVYKPVTPKKNVETIGSDVLEGEVIAWKGTLLTPQIIGSIAACGIRRVKVYKKVRVAIISTGNELQEPGEPLRECSIYDANSYSISAAVEEVGCEPVRLGIVRDDYNALREVVKESVENYDVTIASGSTSAGLNDILYRVLREIGEPGVIIEGLNIKPGKRTTVAIVNGKLVFGLPGFPVSALMVFTHFVKPILSRLAGRADVVQYVDAVLTEEVLGGDRRIYQPVTIVERSGERYVYPVWGESGSIVRMSRSEGFIVVPENSTGYEEGEKVEVYLFSEKWKPANLYLFSPSDPILHVLLSILSQNFKFKHVASNLKRVVKAAKMLHADLILLPTSIVHPENVVLREKSILESLGYNSILSFNREFGITSFNKFESVGIEGLKTAVISIEELQAAYARRLRGEKGLEIVEVNNFAEALHLLRGGVVDAILTSKFYAKTFKLEYARVGVERLEILCSPKLKLEVAKFLVDRVKSLKEYLDRTFEGYALELGDGEL